MIQTPGLSYLVSVEKQGESHLWAPSYDLGNTFVDLHTTKMETFGVCQFELSTVTLAKICYRHTGIL